MAYEVNTGNGFLISDDTDRLDRAVMHRSLSEDSYWAQDIPFEIVERSVRNSLVFVIVEEATGETAGWARVITDRATFAYLADVFVRAGYRGQGLSKQLMEAILAHPDLQNLRRWMLVTADAQSLYARFGFEPADEEQARRIMQRRLPTSYGKT